MGSSVVGTVCVRSADSSVFRVGIGVFMLSGVMLFPGTDEVDSSVDVHVVKVDGWLEIGVSGRVDVDNVVDSNVSGGLVDAVKHVVGLGHIAMPSMMQGSSGDGHTSEEFVGDEASVDADDSSIVCVTIITTDLIPSAAVASMVASSCGKAMMLGSSASRAKVKQGMYIVELNLVRGGETKMS
jgi:hypothetical protein